MRDIIVVINPGELFCVLGDYPVASDSRLSAPGDGCIRVSARTAFVDFAPSVDRFMQDILFDAQTSGGLLISVARKGANELLSELKRRGMADATIIGEVVSELKGKILVE